MGTGLNPCFEESDFFRGQFCLGGHGEVDVEVTDGLDDEALIELAWADGGSVVSALFPSASGVEGEAAFDFFIVGMAFEAAGCEEGLDFVFEKVRRRGGLGAG